MSSSSKPSRPILPYHIHHVHPTDNISNSYSNDRTIITTGLISATTSPTEVSPNWSVAAAAAAGPAKQPPATTTTTTTTTATTIVKSSDITQSSSSTKNNQEPKRRRLSTLFRPISASASSILSPEAIPMDPLLPQPSLAAEAQQTAMLSRAPPHASDRSHLIHSSSIKVLSTAVDRKVPPPPPVAITTTSTTAATTGNVLLCRFSAPFLFQLFLILLAILGVFVVGVDLLRQTGIEQADGTKSPLDVSIGPKTFVVGGGYVLLALTMLAFTINRTVSVRHALNDIPKLYMPINQEDLPQHIYERIHNEWTRVRKIPLHPITQECGQPGWGMEEVRGPNTREEPKRQVRAFRSKMLTTNRKEAPPQPLQDATAPSKMRPIHYKKSIIQSWLVVESLVATIPFVEDTSKATVDSDSTLDRTHSRPPWMSLSQYMDYLTMTFQMDSRIVRFYKDGFYKARYSEDELSAEEYRDIMKCLVVMVKHLQGARQQ